MTLNEYNAALARAERIIAKEEIKLKLLRFFRLISKEHYGARKAATLRAMQDHIIILKRNYNLANL